MVDGLYKFGNIYGERFTGCSFGGNVWSTDGFASTLKSHGSVGQDFIIEIITTDQEGNICKTTL